MKDRTLDGKTQGHSDREKLVQEIEIYECQWNICLIIAKGQGSEGGWKSRSGQVIKSDAMLESIDLILSCIRILRKSNQYEL